MSSFLENFGHTAMAIALPISLTACQPKVEPIKPTAEQQAQLNRLHKNCIAASPGKQGKMMNLARLRKKQQTFTCDEMKLNCETDFASEMCQGPMIVAKVEWAHQKVCRKSADVIAWHNR